ncbi:MAG: DegV family protein [Eubacteriales bacterium]
MIKMITDSTSYIPKEWLTLYDIEVIPLSVVLGDESFAETEISNEDFYKKLDESPHHPTSSQPPIQTMVDVFENHVKAGHQIVACFISSKMSGTYSTAHLAKNMLMETYPKAEIEIIDSKSNSMQLGFAVLAGAKAAKQGDDIQTVVEAINDNIEKSRFLFIPKTMEYLKRSGRLSHAAAIAASLLKIFPILTVKNGVADVYEKIRTYKKAMNTMIEEVVQDFKEKGIKEIIVMHINNIEGAIQLKERLTELTQIEIKIGAIGPVIGAHVGPGALATIYYTA